MRKGQTKIDYSSLSPCHLSLSLSTHLSFPLFLPPLSIYYIYYIYSGLDIYYIYLPLSIFSLSPSLSPSHTHNHTHITTHTTTHTQPHTHNHTHNHTHTTTQPHTHSHIFSHLKNMMTAVAYLRLFWKLKFFQGLALQNFWTAYLEVISQNVRDLQTFLVLSNICG